MWPLVKRKTCTLQCLVTTVRSYHDVISTRIEDITTITIFIFQHVGCDQEIDALALSGLEMHAAETFEFFHRTRNLCGRMMDIELHHLVAVALASIGHRHGSSDTAIARDAVSTQLRLAVRKGCIAQPIAKRVERVVANVDVVALILIVFLRTLSHGTSLIE